MTGEEKALVLQLRTQGFTFSKIAERLGLSVNTVKSPAGKDSWNQSTVKRMLTNEKYKGDALLQKGYTVDFLTKKTKRNCGEIPMYYIEEDHEAIIEPDVFDMVQQLIEQRKRGKSKYSGVSMFSSKVKCGQCGTWFGSKVWHSTDKYRKVIYRCNHKYGEQRCTTPYIMEEEIKAAFIIALNRLLRNREELIANVKQICDILCDTTELDARISEIEYRSQNLRHFQQKLESLNGQIIEFDSTLWGSLVYYITVHDDERKTVTFRDGTEI